jgi:hypothetical protein
MYAVLVPKQLNGLTKLIKKASLGDCGLRTVTVYQVFADKTGLLGGQSGVLHDAYILSKIPDLCPENEARQIH